MFFHFETTRKYTAALLSIFNNIEYKVDNNYYKVPIQELTREKSDVYSQWTDKQIFTGNTQVLPRMALIFNSLEPAREREKIKFHKINKTINGKKISFQYNSVPYNFNYQIILQARGINQAAMIYEQIAAFFNPSYTLRIKEIPIQDEYTSVVVDLNSIDYQNSEYELESLDIVTVTFDLKVRGNIYPAIQDNYLVEQIQLYLNSTEDLNSNPVEFERVSKTTFDIKTGETKTNHPKKAPVVKDIEFDGSKLKCIFEDLDNKDSELRFIWSSNTNYKIAFENHIAVLEKYPAEFTIKCQIVDEFAQLSNLFEKTFKKT